MAATDSSVTTALRRRRVSGHRQRRPAPSCGSAGTAAAAAASSWPTDHVLTNAHNLRDRTTEVTFADGRAAQGELTAVDPDGDLAVLSVDTAGVAAHRVGDEAAATGDLVFAVGPHAGRRRADHLRDGERRRARLPRAPGSAGHRQPRAHRSPRPGLVGQPVVDEAGRLVGLNTARLGEGFYLALPADAELRERVDALAPRRVAPSARARRRPRSRRGGGQAAGVGGPARAGRPARANASRPAAPPQRPGSRWATSSPPWPARSWRASTTSIRRWMRRRSRRVALHVVRGTDELDLTVTFGDAPA